MPIIIDHATGQPVIDAFAQGGAARGAQQAAEQMLRQQQEARQQEQFNIEQQRLTDQMQMDADVRKADLGLRTAAEKRMAVEAKTRQENTDTDNKRLAEVAAWTKAEPERKAAETLAKQKQVAATLRAAKSSIDPKHHAAVDQLAAEGDAGRIDPTLVDNFLTQFSQADTRELRQQLADENARLKKELFDATQAGINRRFNTAEGGRNVRNEGRREDSQSRATAQLITRTIQKGTEAEQVKLLLDLGVPREKIQTDASSWTSNGNVTELLQAALDQIVMGEQPQPVAQPTQTREWDFDPATGQLIPRR